MKILGLNSVIKVKGATATVTNITSKHVTLTGSDGKNHKVSLQKIGKMFDANDLITQ